MTNNFTTSHPKRYSIEEIAGTTFRIHTKQGTIKCLLTRELLEIAVRGMGALYPSDTTGIASQAALEEAQNRIFEYTMLFNSARFDKATLDMKLSIWTPVCGLFGMEEMKIDMPIDGSFDETVEFEFGDGRPKRGRSYFPDRPTEDDSQASVGDAQ
jgi:hypothetical protein